MSGVVLLRPVGGGGSGTSNITISTINGQLVPTFQDTTRSKQLSVTDHPVVWSENRLRDRDWLNIGNAVDAVSGYIADLNGTIVSAVAQCESTGVAEKEIHVFVNGTDQGSLGILGPGTGVTFINTSTDIDFNQGDLIRLRALDGVSGQIEDTVVKLTLKWRA
jgi:hypothetical protein